MMRYISVPLRVESIIDFYDHCAGVLGEEGRYDCAKIEVSTDRMDTLREYYESKEEFAHVWLLYGPKVAEDLLGEVVRISDNFIC